MNDPPSAEPPAAGAAASPAAFGRPEGTASQASAPGASLDDFVAGDAGWPRWLVWMLIALHALIVGAFAFVYLVAAVAVLYLWKTGNQPGTSAPTVFVSASVVWFAFCGLVSGILAKVTLSIVAEVRLGTSRNYLRRLLWAFSRIGVEVVDLVKLSELGVQRDNPAQALSAKALAPGSQIVVSLKDVFDAVAKKGEL